MALQSIALDRLIDAAEKINDAKSAHVAVLGEFLSDLAWMDARVYRCKKEGLLRTAPSKVGDRVHVLEIWNEERGSVESIAHRAEGCRSNWCKSPNLQQLAKYKRVGQRMGFTFRGGCTVLAEQHGVLILSPDVAAPKKSTHKFGETNES